MQKVIVLATRNKGKIAELQQMLRPYQIEIKGLDHFLEVPEVVEDQDTFIGNAIKKAQTAADILQLPVLADDSGLEVDALDGRPGVYSARFAGEHATDQENTEKLILSLQGVPAEKRNAYFRCALALVVPGKDPWTCEGVCAGRIILEPRGTNGFGYDPVFLLPKNGKTMAEISKEEKNIISHRGQAFRKLEQRIMELLN